MSIRFNKALRKLNIGIQTAVEYLEKRNDLGEVKKDPNFSLTDEQYSALEKAFKKDAELKEAADKKIIDKKPQKKGAPAEGRKG